MRRFIGVVLILIFLSFTVGATPIRKPRGFNGQMYDGTLALYAEIHGSTRFVCTAEPFERIFGGYHLMSAGHCVQKIPDGVRFFVSDEIGGDTTPVTVMKAYDGDGLDFSEFELKTAKKYPVFVLGDESGSRVGDMIVNPNFAEGLGKQLSLGTISSRPLVESEACPAGSCAGSFLIQTYGGSGASGSAVFSIKTHKIIGVVDWQYDDPIGFGVIPISKFFEFLVRPGQPHPAEKDGTPKSPETEQEHDPDGH